MNLPLRKRLSVNRSVRVDAPVAALTNTFQPHHFGLLRPIWDGTPAHSSGPRADGSASGGTS